MPVKHNSFRQMILYCISINNYGNFCIMLYEKILISRFNHRLTKLMKKSPMSKQTRNAKLG